MKIYRLEKKVILKSDMDTVWEFFSSPLNLNEITPPDMSFEILSNLSGLKMYQGMIINYKVRPFLNLPLRWTTEITHSENGHYFVDEQRFGPYSFWHHKHFFKKVDGGIEMTDIVDYGLPMGILGRIANSVYVESKLQNIFNYRNEKIQALFASK